MGAATPGKPVPGKPPKGMDEGGPKVTPAPLPPGSEGVIDRFPVEGGPAPITPGKPPVAADPGLFGQLLEGIKKTDKFKNRGPGGLGGFPGDLPPKKSPKDTESRTPSMPAPSMPEFVDPAFDRDRFEKAMRGEVTLSKNERGNIEATPAGMQAPNYMPRSDYRNEIESVLEESKGARTDDVVNKIKEIEEREREKRSGRSPNRFPMGGNERDDSPFSQERFDRYQAGFRPREKEAVFFGEREPSTGSRPRTKESPKRGMRKAGRPVDAEAKNKFEEMLAYMKSFQR
tara:strand:+ start:274 stop:1134 length:861 start_codon:yes stop_codon:yes gene_type:complete